MNDIAIILLAGVFLPLFPMSMVFNFVFDNISNTWLRAAFLLAWPLCGLFILFEFSSMAALPDWVVPLALCTSTLYALRMLSLREINQWSGFLVTSFWALLWLAISKNTPEQTLFAYAISISLPLVLLVLLGDGLTQRFGAAYSGLCGGLARTIPRFAGVLVTVIVAAIATPLFPTFFIMLDLIVETMSTTPIIALTLIIIWTLWSWAGSRLIQGLIVGRASNIKIADLGLASISIYSMILIALAIGGVYLGGVIL